jgi:hypothetical protein
MRSALRVLYFVILQILWIFRSLYEIIMPEKKKKNDDSGESEDGTQITPESEHERRHLIHLFTTNSNQQSGRPVCYMHVCEIISPQEEEMLRCACAKGATNTTYLKYNNQENFPPTSRISRATFTNAWMESFSLVI